MLIAEILTIKNEPLPLLKFLPYLLLPLTLPLSAQSFTAFRGPVYEVQQPSFRHGMPDTLDHCPLITHVVWPELKFLPRSTDEGLPGIDRKDSFGCLLTSTLTIDSAGQYAFVLGSDDGSKLWLDGSLLLDNDRPHQWRTKRDTVYLNPGKYPVKVWYFNAFINVLGLVLDVKYLGPAQPPAPPLELSAAALFAYDSPKLQTEALAPLDTLLASLQRAPARQITVTGYTDDRGSSDYNRQLSRRRAEAVIAYLRRGLPADAPVTFLAKGLGEADPVGDNATEEGRARNRRVVVRVDR